MSQTSVICEPGINDPALEGELLGSHPAWANAGVCTLRLDHLEHDGQLAFYVERATDPSSPLLFGVLANRATYNEFEATPWREFLHPWVASLLLPDVANDMTSHVMSTAEEREGS